jgi:hypothetical protein
MLEILKYKDVNRGSLRGTFDLKVPKWGGFVIRDMAYFEKGDQKWVAFPTRAYEDGGEKKFYPYCFFDTPEMDKAFKQRALDALKIHLSVLP